MTTATKEKQITIEMLQKFCEIRNASPHKSNLQFSIDADSAGFSASDLPKCYHAVTKLGAEIGYAWEFPRLNKVMLESFGHIDLYAPDDDIFNVQ